jgi:hypothetical protein
MEAMKAAGADGAVDRPPAHTACEQLRARDHVALRRSNRANCFGLAAVSVANARKFGHAARIGPRAVPAQHAIATSLRQPSLKARPRGAA